MAGSAVGFEAVRGRLEADSETDPVPPVDREGRAVGSSGKADAEASRDRDAGYARLPRFEDVDVILSRNPDVFACQSANASGLYPGIA